MDRAIDGQLVAGGAGFGTPGGLAVVPRKDVNVRAATPADVPAIDALQRAHGRELGFLPTMALHGKIRLGHVLMADVGGVTAGYLIAADRYQKRDELGYVTQIAVRAELRRHLVAAVLLQAQFDRSAYGCKLYCCWCAQDLKANAFWEAMGFTPIAFRTGSRTRGAKSSARTHLFWQKRVRAGDTTTPWWYPAKTDGGEMREDRLVFPIPPGTHWRDVLPIALPETVNAAADRAARLPAPPLSPPSLSPPSPSQRSLPTPAGRTRLRGGSGPVPSPQEPEGLEATPAEYDAARAAIRQRVRLDPPPLTRPAHIARGGFWAAPDYDDYQPSEAEIATEIRAARAAAAKPKKPAPARTEKKVDPRLAAMARELRDRWTDEVAAGRWLPAAGNGKYALGRAEASLALSASAPPVYAALPTPERAAA